MEQDIRKRLEVEDTVTIKDTKELMEYETYGSMGMLSTLIDILVMLYNRIIREDVITDEETKETFDKKSFKVYLENHFSSYIVKEIYKETKLTRDVFFRLENTDQGLDIIYNDIKPKKLVKWIANIDEDYALVYIRFNHVVYIQNRHTKSLELLKSEHNNCYIYDTTDAKIKEVFN